MSGQLVTICDSCGKERRMPTSWGEKDNPFKGWLSLRYNGDNTKDICPDCTLANFSRQVGSFLELLFRI